MKKRTAALMGIAAVLLILAGVFCGAAAAAEVKEAGADFIFGNTTYTYWHEAGAADAQNPRDYEVTNGTETTPAEVKVHTPLGLGWVANKLINNYDFGGATKINIVFDADSYDMGDHYWLPLSNYQWVEGDIQGTTKRGSAISVLSGGATFTGATTGNANHVATIENLKIINTLQFDGKKTKLGLNNNNFSGFIGEIYGHDYDNGNPFVFSNLTFKNMDVSPDYTYHLDPSAQDKKGFNQIGGVVGHTDSLITFDNVKVTNSVINGSSKIGAFVGYANTDAIVTFMNGCAVSSTTLTGIDSVAGLIGYALVSPLLYDDTTVVDATIHTAIYPTSSTPQNYVDDEMLGIVDVNGNVKQIWTDNTQTTINPSWNSTPVAYVIMGDIAKIDSTTTEDMPVLHAGIAEVYNDAVSQTRTFPVFTLYGKTTASEVPIASVPADFVAAIGEKKYLSVDRAIATAADNETVKVLKNLGSDTAGYHITIASNFTKDVFLDLNGYTINGGTDKTGDAGVATITNYGQITITDSSASQTGIIKRADINTQATTSERPTYWHYVIDNEGLLTIEAGTIENDAGVAETTETGFHNGAPLIRNGKGEYKGYLTINGGTLKQQYFSVIMIEAGEVTISGGTLECKEASYAILNYDKLIITNGKINGPIGIIGYNPTAAEIENNAQILNSSLSNTVNAPTYGSATIKGGIFEKNDSNFNPCISLIAYNGCAEKRLLVEISGGKFGKDYGIERGKGTIETGVDDSTFNAGHIFLKGGVFTTTPNLTIATISDGYEWNEDAKAVARVGPDPVDGKVTPKGERAKVPGAPEGTEISEISGLPTEGEAKITKVIYSVSSEEVPSSKAKETLVSIDINVYKSDSTPDHSDLGQSVTVKFSIKNPDTSKYTDANKLAVYHKKSNGVWEKVSANITVNDDDTIDVTLTTRSFSAFAVVETEDKPTVIHTVKFDLQGHGTAIADKKVESGSKVTRPADPETVGYTFGGWFKEAACTSPWDFNTAVTADMTLYAKWTANKYTIFLSEGDADISGTPFIIAEYDSSSYTPVIEKPWKSGFTLNGWISPNGREVIDGDGTYVPNVSGYTDAEGRWILDNDTELTADWESYEHNFPASASGDVEMNVPLVPPAETRQEVLLHSAHNVKGSVYVNTAPDWADKPGAADGYKLEKTYSVYEMEATPLHGNVVKLNVWIELSDGENPKNVCLRHYTESPAPGFWDAKPIHPVKINEVTEPGYPYTHELIFEVSKFSPFALTYEIPVKKSSSSSQGTSYWATIEPTETPTPTSTPTPTPGVPTVKPVTQQPTEAGASPMPLAGILAGLCAAAVLFGLRRK